MVTKRLDTCGLACPLPVLKTKKAMADVVAGGTLEVLSTDPGSVADFEVYCEITGHRLIEHGVNGGVYRFLIQRA